MTEFWTVVGVTVIAVIVLGGILYFLAMGWVAIDEEIRRRR